MTLVLSWDAQATAHAVAAEYPYIVLLISKRALLVGVWGYVGVVCGCGGGVGEGVCKGVCVGVCGGGCEVWVCVCMCVQKEFLTGCFLMVSWVWWIWVWVKLIVSLAIFVSYIICFAILIVLVSLRGYCTSYQKLACFVLYLKIINNCLKNELCILYKIVQETQKWHWNFSRPSGF